MGFWSRVPLNAGISGSESGITIFGRTEAIPGVAKSAGGT